MALKPEKLQVAHLQQRRVPLSARRYLVQAYEEAQEGNLPLLREARRLPLVSQSQNFWFDIYRTSFCIFSPRIPKWTSEPSIFVKWAVFSSEVFGSAKRIKAYIYLDFLVGGFCTLDVRRFLYRFCIGISIYNY
ncbi:hypothetical protein IMSHALPRED_010221 [Imshaugia aleurites]|uniref:Uncharacterized protein n=1 Tax=Imshaugia aleurites TaxID=172621 RepID=A0A8H3G2G2_9LECA|nr:hypothetical protein IMSHALPRED_010221 [Imshaugia aleurites]